MKSVRILLADDHSVVRQGVLAILKRRPEWEVCGEAATGPEAVEKAKQLHPDIVMLDVNMPDSKGPETARRIMEGAPGTEVLVFTMDESLSTIREMLQAGARGYVFKSDFDRDLAAAVDALSQHRRYLTSKVAERIYEDYAESGTQRHRANRPPGPLTARQRDIVRLLAEGKSNKQVADVLDISVKTAETHRSHVMRKLQAHSFSDLVRYAVREHLVDP
ncbi:MAG: response regulator [Terriglobia bacterium]